MTATMRIEDILLQIEDRLETLRLNDSNPAPVSLDPLSEVGLYLSVDRLIADLYRQYLEAQRQFVLALGEHGADDPMTEIAKDMSESCFCALETRLIELRQDETLAARVEKVQKDQRAAYEREMAARQADYARRGIKQPALPETEQNITTHAARKETRLSKNLSWWAMMALSLSETLDPARTPAAGRAFSRAT